MAYTFVISDPALLVRNRLHILLDKQDINIWPERQDLSRPTQQSRILWDDLVSEFTAAPLFLKPVYLIVEKSLCTRVGFQPFSCVFTPLSQLLNLIFR